MNITLKQLRIFVAVAATENVSRASERLSLSQSAVSMALKELELQLGLQLFDRAGKRMLMNRQGHWLLPRAQHILEQVQSIGRDLGHASRQTLAIGASTTIADCLYPSLAAHLYGRFPDLELHLETGNSSTILSLLLARKIELGLVEGVCQHPQVTATPWRTDRLVIIASPSHPLARQSASASLPVEALANTTWIMRETGSGTRAIFEHAFSRFLTGFNIQTELGHVPTIKTLVAGGGYLACLSEITVKKEVASGELVTLDIRGKRLERQFYMLRHKQGFQSDIQQYLSRWVSERQP